MSAKLEAASPGAAKQKSGESKGGGFDPTTLLSAAEKAVKSVLSEPASTSGKVLLEIEKPKPTALNSVRSKYIWPGEILRDGRMIPHTEATVQVIVHGTVLVEPGTLAKLAEHETEMRATYAEAVKYSSKAAHERFQKQTADLTVAVVSGEQLSGEILSRSRDAFQADYRAKQSALRARLVKLTADHMELCKPILNEARGRIAAFMEEREAQDRAECEAFGIPYHASAVWQAACHLAMRFTDDRFPKPGQWAFPSHVLAGVVNLSTK